jgi:hypothetical protein
MSICTVPRATRTLPTSIVSTPSACCDPAVTGIASTAMLAASTARA